MASASTEGTRLREVRSLLPEIARVRELVGDQYGEFEGDDPEGFKEAQREAGEDVIRGALPTAGDDEVRRLYDLVLPLLREGERIEAARLDYDARWGIDVDEVVGEDGFTPQRRVRELSNPLDDPDARSTWRQVYRPSAPCSRRIRPPVHLLHHSARRGHAPRAATNRRRRGSRRASGVRSGQDPGDPDPDADNARLSPLLLGRAGR
jgi:hypothetical protein